MLRQAINVLVVEDNPGDAERASDDLLELSPPGSRVVVVSTLAEATARLRAGSYDVVVTDLGLPDSRGLETLAGLRQVCAIGSIIVVTGFDEAELGVQAVGEGAADYLLKSELSGRALIRSVRFALERLRRKDAEKELNRAQKLEAINRLAFGVAHHFNNLLTVIIGNGFLIKDTVKGTESEAQLADVLEAADRARVLARHLVAFCESGRFDDLLDVNSILRGVEPALRDTLGARVELVMDLSEAMEPVTVDRMCLEQSLLILALNGRDAMPSGGRLTVSTRIDRERTGAGPGGPLATGEPFVVVTVADEGPGVPALVEDRMFEPFFTTKEVGAGTGLGLSVVHGVVRRAGGRLRVTSRPAGGTSLAICLPVTGGDRAGASGN